MYFIQQKELMELSPTSQSNGAIVRLQILMEAQFQRFTINSPFAGQPYKKFKKILLKRYLVSLSHQQLLKTYLKFKRNNILKKWNALRRKKRQTKQLHLNKKRDHIYSSKKQFLKRNRKLSKEKSPVIHFQSTLTDNLMTNQDSPNLNDYIKNNPIKYGVSIDLQYQMQVQRLLINSKQPNKSLVSGANECRQFFSNLSQNNILFKGQKNVSASHITPSNSSDSHRQENQQKFQMDEQQKITSMKVPSNEKLNQNLPNNQSLTTINLKNIQDQKLKKSEQLDEVDEADVQFLQTIRQKYQPKNLKKNIRSYCDHTIQQLNLCLDSINREILKSDFKFHPDKFILQMSRMFLNISIMIHSMGYLTYLKSLNKCKDHILGSVYSLQDCLGNNKFPKPISRSRQNTLYQNDQLYNSKFIRQIKNLMQTVEDKQKLECFLTQLQLYYMNNFEGWHKTCQTTVLKKLKSKMKQLDHLRIQFMYRILNVKDDIQNIKQGRFHQYLKLFEEQKMQNAFPLKMENLKQFYEYPLDSIVYLIKKPYEIGIKIHSNVHNLNQRLKDYQMNKVYDHPLYTKKFLGSKKRGYSSLQNLGNQNLSSLQRLTFFQWSLKFAQKQKNPKYQSTPEEYQRKSLQILQILTNINTDFIILSQICRPEFRKLLKDYLVTGKIDYYYPQNAFQNDVWTTMIISKRDVLFGQISYKNSLKTNAFCELQIDVDGQREKLRIFAPHLQAKDQSRIRKGQLDAIKQFRKQTEFFIGLGDYNIGSSNKYDAQIQNLKDYIDPVTSNELWNCTYNYLGTWQRLDKCLSYSSKYKDLIVGKVTALLQNVYYSHQQQYWSTRLSDHRPLLVSWSLIKKTC